MDIIANGLLLAGTMAAAFYCYILARRVRALTDLDTGLGGAITALSHQVDEMRSTINAAKQVSGSSVKELVGMTARAEIAAGRLELLLATLHENTDEKIGKKPAPKKRTGGVSRARKSLKG
jgi:outer membrane murein-binding lipoprotein Lpp